MTTIPKPKHCGQNWLDMKPTTGGRTCGQCSKVIVDCSKMSWTDIEQLQTRNNNSVCGMYDPKQLDNWGHEIPAYRNNLLKAAAVTGLAVSLSLPANAQTGAQKDSTVISGRVTDKDTGEELPFANVRLRNRSAATTTDIDGNFKLVFANTPAISPGDTLEFTYLGYRKMIVAVDEINKDSTGNIVKLEKGELLTQSTYTISFYVTKPTLKQRLKRKFKSGLDGKNNSLL